MLSLDQVRLLEDRVQKAVGKIQTLTSENTHLRSELSTLQTRVVELEGLVNAFKDDQGRIEEGILNALDKLSAFEDSVFHADSPVSASVDVQPTQAAATRDEEIIPEERDGVSVDADWEDSREGKDSDAASGDGQMDIF